MMKSYSQNKVLNARRKIILCIVSIVVSPFIMIVSYNEFADRVGIWTPSEPGTGFFFFLTVTSLVLLIASIVYVILIFLLMDTVSDGKKKLIIYDDRIEIPNSFRKSKVINFNLVNSVSMEDDYILVQYKRQLEYVYRIYNVFDVDLDEIFMKIKEQLEENPKV